MKYSTNEVILMLSSICNLSIACFIISALKHLMKRVLERLMDTDVTVDDEEEEEAEPTGAQLHKRVHCSLSVLCDWYSSKTKVGL